MPSRPDQPRSLCSICVRADSCPLLREALVPVLNCAEFTSSIAALRPPRASEPPVSVPARDEDANGFEDLCSTCRDRGGCALPRPMGGVWHCAGYRC